MHLYCESRNYTADLLFFQTTLFFKTLVSCAACQVLLLLFNSPHAATLFEFE